MTATLRVGAPDLEPIKVTKLLGCVPDVAYLRGDVRPRGKLASRGIWSIRASERVPTDADAQIAELLARTTQDLAAWASVRALGRIEMFCGLHLTTGNEGLTIAPAMLAALAARHIELGLDVYAG
jgi:hypothetical protein